MTRDCTCPETYYTTLEGLPARLIHRWHSCHYVKARNTLIAGATQAALVREGHGIPRLDAKRFVEEMDRRWHAMRDTVPR